MIHPHPVLTAYHATAGSPPVVYRFDGIDVVRDDLYSGGTKARFLRPMLARASEREFVYASPAEGGAQTSLSTVCKELGKKATIFLAKRAEQHPRAAMVKRLGGKIVRVSPGYLNVVQARAATYAKKKKAMLFAFGLDSEEAVNMIAAAARATGRNPTEVWCAAGSGTLARGLHLAWPKARLIAVQVGRALMSEDVGGGEIVAYDRPFSGVARTQPPFPSDPHYDAKAWELCLANANRRKRVLFWNVMGPAE